MQKRSLFTNADREVVSGTPVLTVQKRQADVIGLMMLRVAIETGGQLL